MASTTGSNRSRWLAGFGAALLAVLLGLCSWGSVVADRSDLHKFVLPGASDVYHQRLSLGLQRVTFRSARSARDERAWLRDHAAQVGFRRINALADCGGRCIEAPQNFTFVRRSFFGLMREFVFVSLSGNGEQVVRVDLRRCLRLPGMGCWPAQ